MTFGLHMRGVGYVVSYEAALAMYDRAPERKRGTVGSGERKLPGHLKRYTGMTLTAGGVGFVYHDTTVAVWMPDNTCILDLSYESRSTVTFANRFSPRNISVAKQGAAISDGEYWYRTGTIVRISPNGRIESGTLPIHTLVLNKARAKAIRKETNYDEFAKWYRIMAPMADGRHHRNTVSQRDIVAAMQDERQWHDLMTSAVFAWNQPPAAFLTALRKRIYSYSGAYDTVSKPCVETYATLRRWV